MVTLREPTDEAIRSFLASQANLGLTYSAVGATASVPPPGYTVDHTRVKLGEGEKCFAAAKAALESWRQFPADWLKACCFETPMRAGGTVAIVARTLGLWWFNACRIAYVVDEDGTVRKLGVAVGTLPKHFGTGEERFLVEWNHTDDSVWYEILAFSRPHGILARLGYLWFRRVQDRFRRDSAEEMQRAVRSR